MTYPEVWILCAAAVFGIGLYSLLVGRHPLRQLIAIKVMGSAIFVVLVVAAGRIDGDLDGIPKALVLTGIVIAIAAVAFALTLLVRLAEVTGSVSLDPPRLDPPRSDTGSDTRSDTRRQEGLDDGR